LRLQSRGTILFSVNKKEGGKPGIHKRFLVFLTGVESPAPTSVSFTLPTTDSSPLLPSQAILDVAQISSRELYTESGSRPGGAYD